MTFIKKYYPMAIAIAFHAICAFYIGAAYAQKYEFFSNSLMINFLSILLMILVFINLAEIIIFIIHAAKNNNGIWALWIYLFNIYIMPYYNLKYVVKEKNIALRMIIFVDLLIISIVGGIFIAKI